jgi:hypothetical protein
MPVEIINVEISFIMHWHAPCLCCLYSTFLTCHPLGFICWSLNISILKNKSNLQHSKAQILHLLPACTLISPSVNISNVIKIYRGYSVERYIWDFPNLIYRLKYWRFFQNIAASYLFLSTNKSKTPCTLLKFVYVQSVLWSSWNHRLALSAGIVGM